MRILGSPESDHDATEIRTKFGAHAGFKPGTLPYWENALSAEMASFRYELVIATMRLAISFGLLTGQDIELVKPWLRSCLAWYPIDRVSERWAPERERVVFTILAAMVSVGSDYVV